MRNIKETIAPISTSEEYFGMPIKQLKDLAVNYAVKTGFIGSETQEKINTYSVEQSKRFSDSWDHFCLSNPDLSKAVKFLEKWSIKDFFEVIPLDSKKGTPARIVYKETSPQSAAV
jgi:hypothetical protein